MYKAALLTALVIAAVPARADEAAPSPEWITGYWLSCENGRQTAEAWIDGEPGSMLVGVNLNGRAPKQGFEFLRITPVDGKLAYVASPGGAPPTVFPLKSLKGRRIVFENLGHDFPQRIIYERDGDALMARVEGDMNGQTQSMEWAFRLAPLTSDCPAGD